MRPASCDPECDHWAKASVSDFAFLTGGLVVRNQMFVKCAGAGTTLDLGGASLLKAGSTATRRCWSTMPRAAARA